ncbi:MAG TPA: DUF58 domain-containing protein [Verrucomicrobiales bacterium]|nr:DUF58 domain-containing protein [Verrucomicrobiales bacterium]
MAGSDDGETLFDPAFLRKLRTFHLRLRRRRALQRRGQQSTPATGYTREFRDYRSYTAKDDYRAVDWTLYARLGRLYIRLYEEVQELHVHVLVDRSGSMARPYPEKRLAALRLAAGLAYLGLAGRHRVSLYGLGDRVEGLTRPLEGLGSLRVVLDALSGLEFGGQTDLPGAFSRFRPPRARYGIFFIISDCFGRDPAGADAALGRASAWPGEKHVIQIHHAAEASPEAEGELLLADVETGERRRVWFTAADRERYERRFDVFCQDWRRGCAMRQMEHLVWRVDEPFEGFFLRLLARGSTLVER